MSDSPILELPLRPSATARRARGLLLALIACYVLELLVERHWAAAILVGLGGALVVPVARRCAPLRLQLHADGRCFVLVRGGGRHLVTVLPATLILGSHVLLVWRGAQGRQYILLGPDNVQGSRLAALRRRLSRAATTVGARPGTALHSVAAQGSDPPGPP